MVDRSKFIGGSDIGAILGLTPWRTPQQVYLAKTGQWVEEISALKQKFFARRKRQEPVISEMLQDEYGIEVTRLSWGSEEPNYYTDSEFDFMCAEIDFEFPMTERVRSHFGFRPEFCAIPDGETINGEIKTANYFSGASWGEPGTEDVPVYYAAQGMYGLGITGRPAVLLAALFGIDELLCYPIMRDEETISALREKARSFWVDHVLARVPPPPVNVDDVVRMFAGYKGKPAELSDEAYDAVHRLARLRTEAARIKSECDEAEWVIAEDVARLWNAHVSFGAQGKPVISSDESALLTYGGEVVATWNRQNHTRINIAALAEECPDIAARYRVTGQHRVLRPKLKTRGRNA